MDYVKVTQVGFYEEKLNTEKMMITLNDDDSFENFGYSNFSINPKSLNSIINCTDPDAFNSTECRNST